MEITLENLKYPIGKFDWMQDVSKADRDQAVQVITLFPSKIRDAVESLNDTQLNTKYRPEGWTIRQVVHHVADSHMNAYIRFKWALTEDKPIIKAYDQTAWAKLSDSKLDPEVSLVLLDSIHKRWVTIMNSMSESDWDLGYTHPEHNAWQPLNKVAKMYAWHGEHHLAHITRLIEREGW